MKPVVEFLYKTVCLRRFMLMMTGYKRFAKQPWILDHHDHASFLLGDHI